MEQFFAVAVSCDGISVEVIATPNDAAARGACMTGTRGDIEVQQESKGIIAHAFDGDLRACLEECKGKDVGYKATRPFPVMEEGVLGPLSALVDSPHPMSPHRTRGVRHQHSSHQQRSGPRGSGSF